MKQKYGYLPQSRHPPLIPLEPAPPKRSLLIHRILRPAPDLIHILLCLLLGLEAVRRVRIAEAVHVNRLDTDSRTAIPSVARADAVSCVFFTVTPFVQGEVLSAHFGVCCYCYAILTCADRQGGFRFWSGIHAVPRSSRASGSGGDSAMSEFDQFRG